MNDLQIHDMSSSPLGSHSVMKDAVGIIGLTHGKGPWDALTLKAAVDRAGLRWEEAKGHFGGPERFVLIYGPQREQVEAWGRAVGQDAVGYGNGGRHELLEFEGDKTTSRPALEQHGFGSERPADDYIEVPGRGYLRLLYSGDHDHALGKAEPLEKRSKNVREQTRNITPLQANARRARYASNIGLEAEKRPGPPREFPTTRGNKIQHDDVFTLAHETAHAMMTQPGQTASEHEALIGPDHRPVGFNSNVDEKVAQQLEDLVDRRSGVGGRVGSLEGTRTARKDPEHWARVGARPHAEKFDAGAKFDPEGRLQAPVGVDAKINQGRGGVTWLRGFTKRKP
jgi:hypothetical protein